MPAPPTAIAILEFGRLLCQEQRHRSDQKPTCLKQAEEQLIEKLESERSSSLKVALDFNISKRIEPLALRILAYVSFVTLCGGRSVAINDIVKIAAGTNPAAVIEARQTISRMLIAKQLSLVGGHSLQVGKLLLDYLGGGSHAPPLTITECDLEERWRRTPLSGGCTRSELPDATGRLLPRSR